MDEISLVLHRPVADMDEPQRQRLERLHEDDAVLSGRRVLIVDDDIRNIFALTSVLERYNMHILSAETGRDAIQILQDTPDVDVVLMDIMMPEMDGIDTTRAIREIPQFQGAADHRRHGQGDEGRPREVHRGRAPGTTCRSRSIPSRCWPCCGRGFVRRPGVETSGRESQCVARLRSMKTGEQVNILVVDDVPEKAMAIEATLAELGQNVVIANSGRRGAALVC